MAYNPEAGRFAQEDKYLGDTENDQTRNRYIYVLNNPLKYIDPSGLSKQNIYPDWSWWFEEKLQEAERKWQQDWKKFTEEVNDIVIEAAKFITIDWDDPSLIEFAGLLYKPAKACAPVVKPASKAITEALEKAAKGAGNAPNKIETLAKDMKNWLGKDAKVITNKSGDKIFISGDGTRRIRFDINNPSPHNNPHGHVEQLINGKWVKSGPLYPKDVPHN